MKKRYCFVIEINPDQMDDYVALHKDPWRDTLELLQKAGAEESTEPVEDHGESVEPGRVKCRGPI